MKNSIEYAKIIPDFKDADAILVNNENSTLIRGRIHNIIKDPSGNIVDIYIQQGVEFYAIPEEWLAFPVKVGNGIEILLYCD